MMKPKEDLATAKRKRKMTVLEVSTGMWGQQGSAWGSLRKEEGVGAWKDQQFPRKSEMVGCVTTAVVRSATGLG